MRLEYFNDVIIMFLTYSIVIMTEFNLDMESIYNIGFSFISLLIILAMVNLGYVSNLLVESFKADRRKKMLETNYAKHVEHLFEVVYKTQEE